MTNDIPPLQRPEDMPPVHSQADLHRLWRALMGELGFSTNQLWMVVLDADGRCTPVIQHIVEVPDLPNRRALHGLMTLASAVLDEVFPGGSVAFLWARPGRAGLTASDRAWASRLTAAAREAGVSAHAVHLANDEEVRAFAPDDEIASA